MADDSNHRYRSNHPPAGGGSDPYRDGGGDDPLAELARLIGQNDPFADFGQAPQQRQAYQAPAAPARDTYASESRRPIEPRRAAEPAPQDWPQDLIPRQTARPLPSEEPLRRPPLASVFPAQDPLRNAAARQAAEYVPHSNDAFPEIEDAPPAFTSRRRPQPPAPQPSYAASAAPEHDQAAYTGIPPASGHYDDRLYQPEPQFAEAGEAVGEEDYDDPPNGRRRGGLVLVVAILGLAVVGTAGAYAFRSVFSDSKSDSGSRVILADTRPAKIVPDTAGNETGSTKTIYDRINDRGQTERVVPREEQPVEVKDPSRSTYPRVVFPGAPNIPVQTAPTAVPSNGVAASNDQPAGRVSTAPKRVRTITIRPGASGRPPEPATAPMVAPPPPAFDRSATRSVVASAERPAPAPVRRPERSQPPSDGPLSIAPGGNANNSPPPPAPARPSRAPSRVASAPASGGFAVQISSQRSQSEARASFRALQNRFSRVLGGQQSFVRRVDLGSRGVYYRTLIGPFASIEAAGAFCNRLKAAGGQCIIQRN